MSARVSHPAVRRTRLAAALIVAGALAGCSAIDRGENPLSGIQLPQFLNFSQEREEPIREAAPAPRLYNEGLLLLNQGRHRSAALRFTEVDRAHPHSDWARRALIMISYSYFQAQEFEQAATAAERFLTLHPGAQEAPYAMYLMGESHFRLIPDIARDQGRAERALQILTELTQRYPDSEYARPAQRRITIARDQIAGREMDVGRYYLGQRAFGAAANRFKVVVENYQTTRHVEEALFRLVEAYLALGVQSEAQTAAAVLGHNFPESQWYRDAFNLLQRGGLQPEQNQGSWIARAFRRVTG